MDDLSPLSKIFVHLSVEKDPHPVSIPDLQMDLLLCPKGKPVSTFHQPLNRRFRIQSNLHPRLPQGLQGNRNRLPGERTAFLCLSLCSCLFADGRDRGRSGLHRKRRCREIEFLSQLLFLDLLRRRSWNTDGPDAFPSPLRVGPKQNPQKDQSANESGHDPEGSFTNPPQLHG